MPTYLANPRLYVGKVIALNGELVFAQVWIVMDRATQSHVIWELGWVRNRSAADLGFRLKTLPPHSKCGLSVGVYRKLLDVNL